MSGYVVPETNDRADDAYDKRRQEESELVDQAFADILNGEFDSQAVRDALRLGTHRQHHELAEALRIAEAAAYHSGAL